MPNILQLFYTSPSHVECGEGMAEIILLRGGGGGGTVGGEITGILNHLVRVYL